MGTTANGYGVSFWGDENVLKLTVVMVTQLCEYTKNYQTVYFIIIFFNLFYYFHWVFAAVRGLSLVAVSGDYSSLRCAGFSLQWLLLLRSTGSRHAGFSCCGVQAQ